MEWVETTGKSVDEAVELALDKLGVDRNEAEIEVLEEVKSGLFGRVRSDARVRARVMPTKPRAKEDRKRTPRSAKPSTDAVAADELQAESVPGGPDEVAPTPRRRSSTKTAAARPDGGERNGASAASVSVGTSDAAGDPDAIAERFLNGLLDAFGLKGTFERHDVTDGLVEYRIVGNDLGVLIGPKAQTLTAIQELLRTVVHYESDGHAGRILLDVAGYRQKRRAALDEFTRNVAADVLRTNERRALEPMTPADRKVVHDAINSIDGVSSLSEGEEPNRRVVLLPA